MSVSPGRRVQAPARNKTDPNQHGSNKAQCCIAIAPHQPAEYQYQTLIQKGKCYYLFNLHIACKWATLFTVSTFIFSKANGIIYILYLVDFLTNELDLRDDCFPPNNLGKQLSLF
jgi:hypothetical protein